MPLANQSRGMIRCESPGCGRILGQIVGDMIFCETSRGSFVISGQIVRVTCAKCGQTWRPVKDDPDVKPLGVV